MKNVKLDSNQKKAVVDKHHNILVLAPPGSGKTTVIINRMIYLIKQCNVNTANMVIITFTKAAAENMKQRFIKYCNAKGIKCVKLPFFGTFHSLFYRILRNQGESIKIISEKESYYVIKTTLDKYSDLINEQLVKEILNSISMFKNNGDRKSTRLNSSHANISYAVFCLKKKYNILESLSFFSIFTPSSSQISPPLRFASSPPTYSLSSNTTP